MKFVDGSPSASPGDHPAPGAGDAAPTSLRELLRLSPAALATCDIARMNLLCATGLPGAEELDVEAYLQRLDSWAKRIRFVTSRSLREFQKDPGRFEHSEPYWRIHTLAITLWREFKLRYNPTQIKPEDWDFSDSRDQFIHGLLGPTLTGTCSSFPILVTAIGRRLGYPLYVVHSPGHCFCRWDAPEAPPPEVKGGNEASGASGGRFNIEYSGDGFDRRDDASYYERPQPWDPEERKREARRPVKLYLRSSTPADDLASALAQRGFTLHANGRFEEAWHAFTAACRVTPYHDGHAKWAAFMHEKALERALKPFGYTPQMYLDQLESRLHGAPFHFPWERMGSPRPGVPQQPADPCRDPLGAAAWAMIQTRPDLRQTVSKPRPVPSPPPHHAGIRHPTFHELIALATQPKKLGSPPRLVSPSIHLPGLKTAPQHVSARSHA